MRSILTLLEDAVQTDFGASELVKVRAAASDRMRIAKRAEGLESRLLSFIEGLAVVRRRPPEEMYTFAGTRLVPLVFKEVAPVIRGLTSTRPMLLQITRVAPSVLELVLPGNQFPDFDCEMIDSDTLRVGFEGTQEQAWIFEGVAIGIANYFGERVQVKRADSPAYNPRRLLVDVRVIPERRGSAGAPPGGVERRRLFGL